MRKFFEKHPFFTSLVKHFLRIFVGFNGFAAGIVCLVAVIGLIVVAVGAALNVNGTSIQDTSEYVYGNQDSSNVFLGIKVSGTIIGDNDDTDGFASDGKLVSGYDVKQELYDAVSDSSIKGVILEINSPGGTIYGAHAIADGVAYYRQQTHNPVIAYIQGVGASGAYWAAVSTDEIIADYGSDVGSIGVIQGPFEYYDTPLSDSSGVVTQNGIQTVTITAGTSKDIGNPYRKLTTDEIATLQQSVNNDYAMFVHYVGQRRGIPESTIRNKIGAMPYDNKTAQSYKLIDKTGGRQDAYDELATKAKVDLDDYQVIHDTYYDNSTNTSEQSWLQAALHLGHKRQAHVTTSAAKAGTCSLTRANLAFYGDPAKLCK